MLEQALAAEQQRYDRDARERINSLVNAHGEDARDIVANMIDSILARLRRCVRAEFDHSHYQPAARKALRCAPSVFGVVARSEREARLWLCFSLGERARSRLQRHLSFKTVSLCRAMLVIVPFLQA